MKKRISFALSLTFLASCQVNWYGDINLGSDFYYMVQPAFNSIVIPVNQKEPYKSSICVIKDIESVGFNDKIILATSMSEDGVKYWKIDKTVKSEELGYRDDSIIILSNVVEIDSNGFYKIQELEQINLKTKTEYRKQLNYE